MTSKSFSRPQQTVVNYLQNGRRDGRQAFPVFSRRFPSSNPADGGFLVGKSRYK